LPIKEMYLQAFLREFYPMIDFLVGLAFLIIFFGPVFAASIQGTESDRDRF
jgi:hypothetical protein